MKLGSIVTDRDRTGGILSPAPTARTLVLLSIVVLLSASSAVARDSNHLQSPALPLTFEQIGQASHESASFSSRTPHEWIVLSPAEIVVGFSGDRNADKKRRGVLRMSFSGARRPLLAGLAPSPGRVNYLIGSDPTKWRTGVPTFDAVGYENLYAGIDMIVHGTSGRIQYDFVVDPGAGPSKINLELDGLARRKPLRIDSTGDLVIPFGNGELRNTKPVVYQEVDGQRVPVEGRFELRGRNRVGFLIGSYDRTKPLVIDPSLAFSSFLGGSAAEDENSIATDTAGNVYLAGSTTSSDLPVTAGVVQPAFGGRGSFGGDAFVVKYDPRNNKILYTTYLGGTADDNGLGLAVDAAGSAYVVGQTDSKNFPLSHPLQPSFGGLTYDAFVAKLSPSGDSLVYSSYLGGSGNEIATAVAVDTAGNAFVTGYTFSTNFPTTNGFQTLFGGRIFDAFLTKINAAGASILYSSFLGGSSYDLATAIAIDNNGGAYITGFTFSPNFPTKAALQGTLASGTCGGGGSSSLCSDAFVTKFDTLSTGAASLIYSTFLGGNNNDYGNSIAVDDSGAVTLAGNTTSTNFPTVGPLQASSAGYYDAFIAKLNSSGSALVYATYFGGSGYDEITGLRLDASGAAHIVGTTASQDLPVKAAFQTTHGGGTSALIVKTVAAPSGGSSIALITLASDAFIGRMASNGSSLVHASFAGGSGDEIGYGIALSPNGSDWFSGSTDSTNFPTHNAVQSALAGETDLFFASLSGFAISSISPTFGPTAGGTRVTVTGEGFVSGATLLLGGEAATSLSVSSTSITGTTGAHAVGAVDVVVRNPDAQESVLSSGFIYTDQPLPTIALAPSDQQVEVGWSGTVTVSLSNPQSTAVSITLSSSSAASLRIPGSVDVPAGSSSANFEAFGVQAGGPVTITAKLPAALGGAQATARITVIASLYEPRLSAPGQARSAGVGGSFFKSSFWMLNPTTRDMRVRLKYVPAAGQSMGGANRSRETTLRPGQSISYADLLSQAFGASSDTFGVAVVEVEPGSQSPIVTSRTFNDSPSGTFGQYIPGVQIPAAGAGRTFLQTIHGLGGDDTSRSNVGILNLSTTDLQATITVLDPAGVRKGNDVYVSVAPQSLAQVGAVNVAADAGTMPVFSAEIYSTGTYAAYASKLDSKTSDPIYIPSTMEGKTAQWIDGVAATIGDGGTFFRSSLVLNNRHVSSSSSVTVSFTPWGTSTPSASQTFNLASRETKFYRDVLNELFGMSGGVGTLSITSTRPVVAWARTYSDQGSSGTFGQFIPGFGSSDLIGSKGAVLLGLSDNAEFRTNGALINRSDSDQAVTVSVWGADGVKINEKPYTVPANRSLVVLRILNDIGAPGVANVYLKIVPATANAIYAWASSVDNQSTDQTFIRPIALP